MIAVARCTAVKAATTVGTMPVSQRRCPNAATLGPFCRTHALSLDYARPVTLQALSVFMQKAAEHHAGGVGDPLLDAAWRSLARGEKQP